MAAFAKFDFDNLVGETGPGGWTKLLDATDAVSALDPSGIGINSPAATQGTTTNFVPASVPSDLTGIRNGFLKSDHPSNEVKMEFLLTNLNSQKSYEVWVLGGNNTGSSQTQQIQVEGNAGVTPFNQPIGANQLWVNQSAGDSTKQLTDFPPIFVSAPFHFDLSGDEIPDNHVIRVTAIKPAGVGSLAAQVAGVAIREFDPASFTLPPTGAPFTLRVEGGNPVVKNGSGTLLATLPSSGALTINGTAAANDLLNVDLSSGNPVAGGLTFHGGTGANDKLTITGGNQGTVTYNYTNAHDGSVAMSGFGTVTYTGLEPITNTGTATDVIFNLPATADVAFLEDNGTTPADGMLRLRSASATFELTDFAIPTGTLTVNLGGGADSFTVSALPQFTAGLIINGGTGDDAIFLNSAIPFASGKSLQVDLQDDDLAPGSDSISIAAGAALTFSGSGAATLKASQSIALAAGSSIVTAGGPIELSANQQLTPTTGDFIGIDILGGAVKSASGHITISGRGGTGPAAQVGVYIRGAAVVGDTTTGNVTITGRGGESPTGAGNSGVLVEEASEVSTGGGNIAITGTGGADGGLAGNHLGVAVDQSTIENIAAGTLTITGTSSGPGSVGIQVSQGAQALKTASGKMTLSGTGEVGVLINGTVITASADIEVTGTSTSAVAQHPGIRQAGNLETIDLGNIKLIADKMDVQQRVDAQSRSVTLVPKTPGRAIDLGTDDSSTHLGLLDVEQSVIAAGTLNIGDVTSGPITVSDDILRPPTLPIVANVNLTSGGAIHFVGGQLDSGGGNVLLTPGPAAAASFGNTGPDLITAPASLAFASGADVAFAINGTTAETQYQVLTVTGNLNLTGTDLVVTGSHTPAAGNTFAIVQYTGTRTGTFNNSSVTLSGQLLNVVYDDANKQVRLEPAGAATLSATIAGDSLTIDDTDVVGKNNDLTVSANSGNLVISDANERFISAPPGGTLSNGGKTLTIPLATITGVLTINTEGGNDTLTVDFAGGNITTNTMIYNGGTQSGTPGDNLKLVGGTFANVTHNFANSNTGTIFLDGHTVTYSGLEPVDMSGTTATNLVFNLPLATSNAVLEDDGTSGNGISRFRSANSTFESTTFSNPTGSLTINRGNAADTLTTNALPDFTAGLLIATAANPLASVTFARALTLAADKGLTANAAGTILLSSSTSDIATSGNGAISFTTARDIQLAAGSSITTVNGSLLLEANQQATPTTGDFKGIDVNNATIQATGTGAVTVRGKGGNDSGGGQYGVHVQSGAIVQGGSGGLQLTGLGGASGTSGSNVGVFVESAGLLTAIGSGPVTVQGTGGAGSGGANDGVRVRGGGSAITSGGGNVQVTGQGGGGGSLGGNYGVQVDGSAQISATGSGTVVVQGIGGSATPGVFNAGVRVSGFAIISSSAGNVEVNGQGGGSGTSSSNFGVELFSGQVSAGANGAVTVQGTGGAASGNANHGIWITGLSEITSGGGDIQVTGQGGGSGSSGDSYGVIVQGKVTAAGTGAVVLQGTGGTGSGSDNIGVNLLSAGASISSAGGMVQVTGIEGAGISGTGISISSGEIATVTGTLTLIGNSMALESAANLSAGAMGIAALRPFAIGAGINLGLATDPVGGPLALTDAELDRITAGQIIIGDSASGPVTFSAPISLANSDTLEIITGSTINDTGPTTVFTDTNLALTAAAGIGTTSPLNIAVSNLAAAGGTGGVNVNNTGNLAVTTVADVIGATGVNSSVTISAAGSITVDQPMTATAGGGIELTAISGSITVNAPLTAGTDGVALKADTGIQLATAAADITSTGPIELNADFDANASGVFSSGTDAKIEQTGTDIPVTITASDITLGGTIDSSGILTLQPSTPFRTIAIHDSAGNFSLSAAELTRAGTNNGGHYTIGRLDGTGDVRIAGNGSVQLPNGDFSILGGNVTFNGPLLMSLTAPTLEIFSSGSIQQTFTGNAITNATNLLLDSALGVGALVNPLRVANGQAIAARATSSGSVAIASTDSLTSRTVGGVSGILTNSGDIQLEAFNFRVGLTGVGLGPINAGAGSVSIAATAPTFTGSGGLTINDTITAGADSTLTTNALFLNSPGSVDVGSARLIIQANVADLPIDLGGNDVSAMALGLADAELDRIIAGTLHIGDLPLGGQITISAPINLANNATPIPTLHLASVGGIIDANAAGADLTVANLALEAFFGDDTSNLLTTQVNNLAASSVNAGDIRINNLGPLTITSVDGIGGISCNGGSVEITSAGPLTLNNGVSQVLPGGIVSLTAAGDDQLLTINGAIAGDNAILTADKMALLGTINVGSGMLTLVPENTADTGDAIILGSTTDAAADALELSNDEFFISASEIHIGNENSGPFTVSANIRPFVGAHFFLESGGAINFTTGSLDTAGGRLTLSPGPSASVGVANAGPDVILLNDTLSFAPGSDLAIAINGTAVDTQYHQLNVAGQVDLTGVDLALSLGFSPPGGSQFVLVNNDGVDPIAGTFNGLSDGQFFTIGSGPQTTLVQINYAAGDGNDVVLTSVDPTDPSLNGTSGDDNWLVRRAAADVEILLNGAVILVTPFASLSRIHLDGLAGNDTLTVDLTGGDPIPSGGINFVGGDPATGPGDRLIIAGGAQGTVTYNYTNAHDGSIVMSNFGTITYTGLEPILNNGAADDVIINLPATANSITLADDGAPGNGLSRLSGATIETTDFANPTNSLTINRGSAADTLTIDSLPDFNAALSIGSALSPFGSIVFGGSLTLAANLNLLAHATDTISLSDADSDISTSGMGAVSLTTSRDIALSNGASLTTVNGNLTLSANQQATPSTGDFSGVLVSGATVRSTGTGNVTIMGRGGNSASGGQLMGVLVNSGGVIEGGTAGTLSITGFGGDSSGSVKTGVRVQNAGSLITTAGADVFITGTGGTGGSFNRGVDLFSGGMITAGGTGKVTVVGTGGSAPGNENQGVLVNGATTAIASTAGDVQILGTGGGSGASTANGGVITVSGGSLSAGGAGTLQITGTAGNAATASNGVGIGGPVTSGGGDITISGTPVNDSAPGLNLTGVVTPGPGGDVSVVADRITITAPGGINAPSQIVVLRAKTVLRAIDIGGPDSATSLGLSDQELDLVTADELMIGNFAFFGPLTITSDITRPAATAGSQITLATTDAIAFTTGSIDTSGGDLFLFHGLDVDDHVSVPNDGVDINVGAGLLDFVPGGDLAIAINGSTVDTDFDQLNVVGNVDLAGVSLDLSGSFTPAVGANFTIVNNDGTDPIIGTFSGHPEGDVFRSGFLAASVQITYVGGDGNDVVLTVIDDTNPHFLGTPSDDVWLVRRVNGQIGFDMEVLLNGQIILSPRLVTLQGMTFDGLAGNDSLEIDLTEGDVIPTAAGITFLGGDPTTGPGDRLIITGGAQGTVTYNYSDSHDGSIVMGNFGAVTFTGLESILNTGTASDVNVSILGGGSSLTLGDDDAPGNNLSRLSGTPIPTTDFASPTNSLDLTSGAADSLTVGSLPGFTAGLTIGSAAAPLINVTFTSALTLAADKDLAVQATRTISLPNQASDLSATGLGVISLQSRQRDIQLLAGASLSVENGDLTLSANQELNPISGDFSGVLLNGATIQSTGSGNITIQGRGGDAVTGSQFGVRVIGGAKITGGTSGLTSITGSGGPGGGSANTGISIGATGTTITSIGANVFLTGIGGSGDTVTRGVSVFGGAQVSAGGLGTVTINGTGGPVTINDAQGVFVDNLGTLITSSGGDVTIVGQGGGSGTATSNTGVVVNNNAAISAGGSARLDITGTAGNPATGSSGVNIVLGSLTTAGGDITLTGTAGNAAGKGVVLTSTVAPGPGGSVAIIADSADFNIGASINAGAQSVVLRPKTPGTQIDLGGADAPGVLGVNDAGFDRITAGTLQIGDPTSGSITITADITRPASTNVNLISNGAINFTTGSLNTAGGNLTLTPGPDDNVGVANDATDAALGPTGALSFAPSSDLAIAINGLTVDTEYHQLNVTGLVNLTGVDLVLSGTYAPAAGDTFVLVSNDGGDPIVGTFTGLDNNELFTIDAGPLQGDYRIVYDGGDGNDVVLTALNSAPAFIAALDEIAVNDETGSFSVAFATGITAGPPRESTQQLEFKILGNTDPSLFAVPPSIDADGLLTFTPNFNVAGQAVITVALQDNGGTASGGSDTSAEESFTIDVAKLRVWHNAKRNLDVTGDGNIFADDALEIINLLNAFGPTEVPTDGRATPPYYDTDGDGIATAGDALDVINLLNAFGPQPGEGESTFEHQTPSFEPRTLSSDPLAPIDDLLTLLATDLATQSRRRR